MTDTNNATFTLTDNEIDFLIELLIFVEKLDVQMAAMMGTKIYENEGTKKIAEELKDRLLMHMGNF